MDKNGYDRYLEFQFRWCGDFFRTLFQAIALADHINIEKLRAGFPEEVEAYQTFTRIGKEEFLAKCSQDHPLLQGVKSGEYHL